MIVHLSKSARMGIVVGAFVLVAFLSWSSIRVAVAEYYSGLGTLQGFEKATQLEPKNAQYWDLLGRYWQENIEQQNFQRAIESYRISLSLDPGSATTRLDLASAYESEGDIAAARTAFLEAKRVYPISADVAWRYGNFLLRQDEVTGGLLEIHRAVEADPRRGLEAFLTCRHVEPNLDVILNRVLPPVSSVYLDVNWQLTNEGNTDSALKVWAKLVALHPKLQKREVFFFVEGLLNNRQTAEALRVWKQAVDLMDKPKTEDPPGSLIWDGGFETDIFNGGLAWRIEPYQPIRISHDQRFKHSGTRSLRIDIAERDISDFVGVCQSVVVEPNTTYEFSAWLRTKDLPEEGGVFFRLMALDIQGSQVISSPKLGGTNEWTRVSVPWTSPDHSHLSQVCLSRSREFQRVPGTVWVDDVSSLKIDTAIK